MKNTKYLVAGVWCALLVALVAARSTTALAAGSVGASGSPGSVTEGGQLAFSSSTAPVLLADATPCDWEDPNQNGAGCDGDAICTTGNDSGTCVLPQSYTPPSSGSGTGGGSNPNGCDWNQYTSTGCLDGYICSSTDPNDTSATCGSATTQTLQLGDSCVNDPGNCGPNLTCGSDGNCDGDGSVGAHCGGPTDEACADGSACPSSHVCPAAGSGTAGESGGSCNPDEFPNSGGCDPSANLTCNSSGTCVASSSTGDIGSTCTDSNGCYNGEACSPSTHTCVAFTCSSQNQACLINGEACQTQGSDGLQCTPPGGASSTKLGGTGAGGSTTQVQQHPAGTTVTKNAAGQYVITEPGGAVTTLPLGQTATVDSLGQVTITPPSSSASSSGLGTTPGVCGAGLGALDSAFSVKICNFNGLILAVVNVLLSVLAIIAALYIIIGGFRYVMSNGDEKAAGAGLATVKNAAIGLAIAILAYAIIAVVVNTASSLGGNSSSNSSSSTTTTSSGAKPS